MKEHCCDDVLKGECWKERELLKKTEVIFKLSGCKVKCLLCLIFDIIFITTEDS